MKTLRRIALVVAVNTAAGCIPTVLTWITAPMIPWSVLLRQAECGWAYSYCIGTLCFLLTERLARWIRHFRRALHIPAFLAAFVLLAALGAVPASLFLVAMGWVRADLWHMYLSTLSISVAITIPLASAITVFSMMLQRLDSATIELRNRQLAGERAGKLLTEARLAALESRVHPHFLFNTLNSISALIREDPVAAERTVERLAGLLRYSLDSQRARSVPLRQEMRVVADYLEIEGTSTDPVDALAALGGIAPDVLFLDIQMPGMNGFEMLSLMDPQPIVVFTTAYDQYALRAFEVNSIDYLLKPVTEQHLLRALDKIERLRGVPATPPGWKDVLAQLAGALRQPGGAAYPERIASRLGERIQLLEVARITHCFARHKLTYAAMDGKNYVVDYTVAELEEKLDPRQFARIHRSTLVNIAWVREIDAWFGGKLLVRLKDAKGTELQVARDRAAELKQRIGRSPRGVQGGAGTPACRVPTPGDALGATRLSAPRRLMEWRPKWQHIWV